MTQRRRHPNKEIEAAVRHAEGHGWICILNSGSGYAWGKLRCPYNDKQCRCGSFCSKSVWSTPKVPEDMADSIKRTVEGCVCRLDELARSINPEKNKAAGDTSPPKRVKGG